MKIEYVNGCTCDSLTIDGVETVDMDKTQIKEAIIALLDRVSDMGKLQYILSDLTEDLGDFEDLGTCETCGDWITKYTVNI